MSSFYALFFSPSLCPTFSFCSHAPQAKPLPLGWPPCLLGACLTTQPPVPPPRSVCKLWQASFLLLPPLPSLLVKNLFLSSFHFQMSQGNKIRKLSHIDADNGWQPVLQMVALFQASYASRPTSRPQLLTPPTALFVTHESSCLTVFEFIVHTLTHLANTTAPFSHLSHVFLPCQVAWSRHSKLFSCVWRLKSCVS